MSAQETERLVRDAYDAFNDRDFARSQANAHADIVTVMVPTGQEFRGHAGQVEYLQGWATAFPDSQVEVVRVVASETGAAVEFRGIGTHTGPLATPMGVIAPTGRSVDFPLCDVWEVRDGKVAATRNYFDVMTLLAQLGVVPPAGMDLTGVRIGEAAGTL
jgi:steroid delta-isomerase-like uncharacterized protein